MNENKYKFLEITGQVNTIWVINVLFETIDEKVKLIDENAYGNRHVLPNNYVYMEWIGYPEKLNEAQPLLGFLKNRLQSYVYPFEFTITINIREKGE